MEKVKKEAKAMGLPGILASFMKQEDETSEHYTVRTIFKLFQGDFLSDEALLQ